MCKVEQWNAVGISWLKSGRILSYSRWRRSLRPWLANDRVFKTQEEIRKERPVMAEAQANHEQIRYWNEQSGPRWVKQQQRLDAQLDRLGLAAMQRAGVKPGEHVLDVGCGCGQTSLELAQRLGPRASVF